MIESLVERLTAAAQAVAGFIRENERLVQIAFQVGGGLLVVGTALVATGQAINIVAAGMGGLLSAYRALSAAAVAFGIKSSAAWAAATLGISLVIAGFVAVGVALYELHKRTGIFDPLIEAVQELWTRMKERLQPAFEKIQEAMGRLFEALQPLVPLIEAAMVTAVEGLAVVFESILVPAVEAAVVVIERLADGISAALNMLGRIFARVKQLSPILGALGIATLGNIGDVQAADGMGFARKPVHKKGAQESTESAPAKTRDAREKRRKELETDTREKRRKKLDDLAGGKLDSELAHLRESAPRTEGTFSSMAARIFVSRPSANPELDTLKLIEKNTKKISKAGQLSFAE